MNTTNLRIEVFAKKDGWVAVSFDDMVTSMKGVLFRMFNMNEIPIYYHGYDRWIFLDMEYKADTGETKLNVKPYISLVVNGTKNEVGKS